MSGFTIVELLVVIVVIGILAGLVLNSFSGAQGRARDAKRKTDIRTLTTALEIYYAENGQYPSGPLGSTAIDGSWATTLDASWQPLMNTLKSSGASEQITDPKPDGKAAISGGFSYDYYGFRNNLYCGVGPGQGYILVYRLETEKPADTLIGDCSTGTNIIYPSGVNYRVVRN